MQPTDTISGVLLSSTMDLKTFYGLDAPSSNAVRLLNPDEVPDPADIRFAVCWLPEPDAFQRYPNLEMAMSIGAGVDALLGNPSLSGDAMICRVRDPHQADLMAGYAAHEVLHVSREFANMAASQAERLWAPPALTPPEQIRIAVLGNGTMGAAVTRALAALGFTVRVACRRDPPDRIEGVEYLSGERAVHAACKDGHIVINVLPLTPETENILNARLFETVFPGAWLIQIGRGEHLHEADFLKALQAGHLAGASLDVFRTEPLPPEHPFWSDPRIRVTPHIASDSTPSIVADQIVSSAEELLRGDRPALSIDRNQGY